MKKTLYILALLIILVSGCSKDKTMEWTSLAEGQSTKIPALTNGKIDKIFINEGDLVKENQLLAVVDTLSFYLQKQEILSALGEIEIQNRLYDLRIKQAEDDLNYTESRFARTKSLVENNSAPEQNLDDLNNLKKKSETALSLVKKEKELLIQKQNQLRAKLSILDKNISDAVIKAPYEGMISEVFIKENEAAVMGKPVFELIGTSYVEAVIYVKEDQLASFKPGQEVKARIDGDKNILSGKIVKISNKSEFTPKQILTPDNRSSLVYGITIRIDNPNLLIKDGMPVRISRN
jgi:HlyD family secretion protein